MQNAEKTHAHGVGRSEFGGRRRGSPKQACRALGVRNLCIPPFLLSEVALSAASDNY